MMPVNRQLSLVFISLCLTAAVLSAQQQLKTDSIPGDSRPLVFRSDTRVVVCPTAVFDKSGRLVTDLQKSAFAVYENKEP